MSSDYFAKMAEQELLLAASMNEIRRSFESANQQLRVLARSDRLTHEREQRIPAPDEELDTKADSISDRILRTADSMTKKGLL